METVRRVPLPPVREGGGGEAGGGVVRLLP